MSKIVIEIIGIIATLLVFWGMTYKTTTIKGSIWMRALNIVGSIVFIVYGCLVPAYSTVILNATLIIVNGYHLVILIKSKDKK